MECKYKIEKHIATISRKGSVEKQLNFISWDGNPAKYDLRVWRDQKEGEAIPGKGLTLDKDELGALALALSAEDLNQALKEAAQSL